MNLIWGHGSGLREPHPFPTLGGAKRRVWRQWEAPLPSVISPHPTPGHGAAASVCFEGLCICCLEESGHGLCYQNKKALTHSEPAGRGACFSLMSKGRQKVQGAWASSLPKIISVPRHLLSCCSSVSQGVTLSTMVEAADHHEPPPASSQLREGTGAWQAGAGIPVACLTSSYFNGLTSLQRPGNVVLDVPMCIWPNRGVY